MMSQPLTFPRTIPAPIDSQVPVLGSLMPMSRDPLNYMLANHHRFPEIVAVNLMGTTYYQVTHPDLVEQVLAAHNTKFIKDKGLKVYARPVFGNGLLSSDGDFWLRQRRMAQPAFHRQRIAAYGDVMTRYTERAIHTWRDGETRDIHEDMMHLTLEVVAKTLFDVDEAGEVQDIGASLDTIMDRFDNSGVVAMIEQATGRVINLSMQRRYEQAVARLDAIVDGVIAKRRAHAPPGEDQGSDLLGMFLQGRDEDGNGMTDEQLCDECKTMFLAGHETTALTLSWSWWLLSLNPEVKLRLRDELMRVLGGRLPMLGDLPELVYTEQVIRESMRMMPPAWSIQREATVDVELTGPSGARYCIPKGRDVMMSQYAMHRDPRWFDQPELFKPERWTPDFIKHLPKYAYFPFGGGPRLCIGQQFAMMEAVLMLAAISQRFDLTLAPGQRVEPQPSITMRPKHGLRMIVRSV